MKIPQLIGIALVFALGLSGPAWSDDERRGFGKKQSSKTALSAAQEVQAVTDEGTGEVLFFEPATLAGDPQGHARATITFDRGFERATVFVRFNGLTSDLTRLHLHCNIAGKNGPVAIGLIDTLNPGNDNSQDISQVGHRVFGTLTNENFPGGDRCSDVIGRPVNNVVSLADAIDAGQIYWNLHTELNPPGELRGQARPAGD